MHDESESSSLVPLTQALGSILDRAAASPQSTEIASELGGAVLTVSKLVNTALLPIAAINFGFAKARAYFNSQFEGDLDKFTSRIEPQSLQAPPAYVAGPVLRGLAWTHENPPLKDLYLALLARSMDTSAAAVHPAYSEVVGQLSPEEAENLAALFSRGGVATVRLIVQNTVEGTIYPIADRLYPWVDETTGAQVEQPKLGPWIRNYERLGLYEVDFEHSFRDPIRYAYVEASPEHDRACKKVAELGAPWKVDVKRGMLKPTAFGINFGEAAGLLERSRANALRTSIGAAEH